MFYKTFVSVLFLLILTFTLNRMRRTVGRASYGHDQGPPTDNGKNDHRKMSRKYLQIRRGMINILLIFFQDYSIVYFLQFRGFYKGIGFPLLSTGTLNSLFFGVYGNCLHATSNGREAPPSYSNVFWAGCAGGVAQLVVACPVDLVKIKMQMQTGNNIEKCLKISYNSRFFQVMERSLGEEKNQLITRDPQLA